MSTAVATARARPISRERVTRGIWRAVLYVVVICGTIMFTFPFFWMIKSSVTPAGEMMLFPPPLLPSELVWDNYVRAWTSLPFPMFYRNTVFVTLMGMIGVIVSSSVVAFAFARMRWPGRDKFFIVMIATLMLPDHVTFIPTYVVFAKIGWINTFLPLLAPEWVGSPFIIFLMRQYMMTIPLEMDDAARIDGAGWLQLFTRIILPLSLPVLGVAAIYSFQYHWNAFLRPLIYLNRLELFTVPLGMAMLNGRYGTDFGGLMAMSTVSIIPVMILFFVAQRYFIQGVVVTGVKG
ncbi:MAG TPA: carbohydrate ABC transporter permease [Chloroflexota bacterium]|jgi:ABC-type glycerol-3-phosphate transport system permease component